MIDNDIIEWLNNYNEQTITNNNNNNNTTLIECILIISINGILIERQSLIDYCNSVISNNNNSSDIRNNNNYKRYNRVDNEISPTSYFYGLSSQQFQTIYNNINSLSHKSNSTTITTLNNNNSSTEYISSSSNNSNKIKFNSSITIISENNKLILNSKQQQHNDNNNNNTSTAIKSCSRDIDIIFFQVWRNIVIRNEVLFHTRLYNIHWGRYTSLYFKELSTYKYKSYLDHICLFENYDDDISNQIIPYGVSEVFFDFNITLQVGAIPNSVTSVVFNKNNQEFTKSILPDSITNLEFNVGCDTNQPLSLEWLPSALKSLSLGYEFQHDIEPNQLPGSITQLVLHQGYQGKIVEGSIPLSALDNGSFNYKFESNYNENVLTNETIPVSTTNLKFDDFYNHPIKPGDIPHNVVSMKFSSDFDNEIQVGSLPLSLKSLDLGQVFDQPINTNVLPSNLTSIHMGAYNQPLTPNLFPQSITSIKMFYFNEPIPDGYFYNYTNLKSLKFHNFDKEIPVKTLPHSLTSLKLGYDYDLVDVNILPNSLSTLTIGKLNEDIKLPSSITSLTLYTDQPISVGILPCNLEQLHIDSNYFDQQLSFESFEQGILPRSLQSIYIERNNINFINILQPSFFKKYIKFSNYDH